VVLVGHSWGGTVISEAGNDARVKSLVYVAAFAPDSGQSTADLAEATLRRRAARASQNGGRLFISADRSRQE
jgi:pimeloyl-ACP methyl ester carboxylesterase